MKTFQIQKIRRTRLPEPALAFSYRDNVYLNVRTVMIFEYAELPPPLKARTR